VIEQVCDRICYDGATVISEKTEVIGRLERGMVALRTAIAGCPAAVAAIRPAPDRWSVLDCLEHLVLAEEYLCAQLVNGTASAPTLNDAREARIVAVGTSRDRRIPAPQVAQPRGRWLSIDAAMEGLDQARVRTVAFVEQFDGDLRAWQAVHPIAGVVNGYEMLLMIAVHPVRHAQQIEEIRAQLSSHARPCEPGSS
jgi:hypothetical protein